MPLRYLIAPGLLAAATLLSLPTIVAADETSAQDHAVVQALLRIPGAKIDAYPSQKNAVLRHLARLQADSPNDYVKIAAQLGVQDRPEVLYEIVAREEGGQAAIDAASLLLNNGKTELLQSALTPRMTEPVRRQRRRSGRSIRGKLPHCSSRSCWTPLVI